jgi:hypothetical protein
MKWSRIAPGLYESDQGHVIERRDDIAALRGGPAEWYVTWPNQRVADAAMPTYRDAKAAAEGRLTVPLRRRA